MHLLPIILMFVVLWFLLMIRPQMKKEHKAMVEALARRTTKSSPGGIVGRRQIGDSFVQVEVGPNTVVAARNRPSPPCCPKGT